MTPLESVNQEKKTPRSLEEIRKEYSSLCAQAGQLQYQVFCGKKDLEVLNKTLRDLNFEAAASAKAEEAAKVEAQKPSEEKSDA